MKFPEIFVVLSAYSVTDNFACTVRTLKQPHFHDRCDNLNILPNSDTGVGIFIAQGLSSFSKMKAASCRFF